MPVRARIHSSEVSTVRASSSLVTTRSGRYPPTPARMDRFDIFCPVGKRSGGRESAITFVLVRASTLVQPNPGQILTNVVVEAVHDHVHRHIDGMGEAFGI